MTARVALIGANGHGRTHRRAIAELDGVDLVAIGDVAAVPDVPEGVPVFADHRDLLAATGPDIVIVCTPPHTHLRIAEDALRSGADVLLEKPPVLDGVEPGACSRWSTRPAGLARSASGRWPRPPWPSFCPQ